MTAPPLPIGPIPHTLPEWIRPSVGGNSPATKAATRSAKSRAISKATCTMNNPIAITRRLLLGAALGLLPVLVKPEATLAQAGEPSHGATPEQTEGPFYPVRFRHHGNDLTRRKPGGPPAEGQHILVSGVITGADSRPVPGATVEIWQTDAFGEYNHPRETRSRKKDPNFLYWGDAETDSEGRYRFRTVQPLAYRAGSGWTRPPHIHFKVKGKGYRTLTTQLYFPDQPLNGKDPIFREIPVSLRARVIARPAPREGGVEGAKPYRFDLVLA